MWMDLVARVQGIILRPKEEWEKIKTESITIKELFTSYALILAAIPAIASFIGRIIIGRRVLSYGFQQFSLVNAFFYAVMTYLFALLTAYVLGIIINAFAPTFSSKSDAVAAMKLAVFCMTPYWVASVLFFIPFLWILVIFAGGLYGLYVLYLGFSAPMMDTPQEKVMSYFITSTVIVMVLFVVVRYILDVMFTLGSMAGI